MTTAEQHDGLDYREHPEDVGVGLFDPRVDAYDNLTQEDLARGTNSGSTVYRESFDDEEDIFKDVDYHSEDTSRPSSFSPRHVSEQSIRGHQPVSNSLHTQTNSRQSPGSHSSRSRIQEARPKSDQERTQLISALRAEIGSIENDYQRNVGLIDDRLQRRINSIAQPLSAQADSEIASIRASLPGRIDNINKQAEDKKTSIESAAEQDKQREIAEVEAFLPGVINAGTVSKYARNAFKNVDVSQVERDLSIEIEKIDTRMKASLRKLDHRKVQQIEQARGKVEENIQAVLRRLEQDIELRAEQYRRSTQQDKDRLRAAADGKIAPLQARLFQLENPSKLVRAFGRITGNAPASAQRQQQDGSPRVQPPSAPLRQPAKRQNGDVPVQRTQATAVRQQRGPLTGQPALPSGRPAPQRQSAPAGKPHEAKRSISKKLEFAKRHPLAASGAILAAAGLIWVGVAPGETAGRPQQTQQETQQPQQDLPPAVAEHQSVMEKALTADTVAVNTVAGNFNLFNGEIYELKEDDNLPNESADFVNYSHVLNSIMAVSVEKDISTDEAFTSDIIPINEELGAQLAADMGVDFNKDGGNSTETTLLLAARIFNEKALTLFSDAGNQERYNQGGDAGPLEFYKDMAGSYGITDEAIKLEIAKKCMELAAQNQTTVEEE